MDGCGERRTADDEMADLPERGRRGILFVLSSPSGAGKSTLAQRLLTEDGEFMLSVSATTRPPREGEVDGRDYHFVSAACFADMVRAGELLEHARVFGSRYGTPREPVLEAIRSGRDVLFDVDWQGAQQLRASELGHSVVQVFILPPSIAELERRLTGRAKDAPAVIARRMAKARDEISHWAEYDYVLINDELERTYTRMRTIIAAERMRWTRQSWLFDAVDALYREFEARSDDTEETRA